MSPSFSQAQCHGLVEEAREVMGRSEFRQSEYRERNAVDVLRQQPLKLESLKE